MPESSNKHNSLFEEKISRAVKKNQRAVAIGGK
jgi:hypothetical protein